MFADIANEFENITKFGLLQYFTDYRNFLQNDYSYIYDYYAGNSETIDSSKISTLNKLLSRSNVLLRQFSTFASKFGNVGYWELQEYCQDLNDTLERITKLPKYNRTSKSCRGYKPYIQTQQAVGGMKTMQDVASDVGGVSETDLILNNDLEEVDYEIDKLSSITAFVDNSTGLVVETILEQPIGNKIYGRDLTRKITLDSSNNDLSIEEYEDNVEQKCDILLELNKGDIPEYPNLGKNLISGNSYKNYNYSELAKDLEILFQSDDLFESISISDISFGNGDLNVTCDIRTKYTYSTQKTIKV